LLWRPFIPNPYFGTRLGLHAIETQGLVGSEEFAVEAILDTEPVDPELLTRLGKVVILGAQVESWLAMLLGTLLGANLGASGIVTNSLSISAQIKCIRGLLSVHAHKEPAIKDVTALLDRADEIRLAVC
jgi:hypothetical protein